MFETSLDIAKGPSARGVEPETFLRNVGEGLRNGLRHNRLAMCRSVPNGWMLGHGLDQGDAERPDVRGRGDRLGGGFRCVIDTWRRKVIAELASDMKAV